jgi:two-component system sensor histidine kinase UhpB
VRGQLLTVFVLIEFMAALVAGGVVVLKARTATQVEMAASMQLAELLVSEAAGLLQQEVPAERFLEDLASHLRALRHVRISVTEAAGRSLVLRPVIRSTSTGEEVSPFSWLPSLFSAPAPAWFAELIAPPVETRQVPVLVNRVPIGSVEIVSEPKDEIDEVWENIAALAGIAGVVNLCVIVLLYVLFGRVLEPLTGLARGLHELERRHYQVRLPPPKPRELAAIAEQFNALGEALEAARAENLQLSTRLVTAQDDERRRTALDLHDEFGPSLFGLRANAASIAAAAGRLENDAGRSMQKRVQDILAIIEHLQATNRSILNRLRPMALGHVPLHDLLSELVRDRERANPEIAFSFTGERLARSYGDSIDLTIYRCIQESITNAIRHANARRIAVTIGEAQKALDLGKGAPSELTLTVCDDGLGVDPTRPRGYGTTGMEERVRALGGRYMLETEISQGTCVRILIPVRPGSGAADPENSLGGAA